MDILITIIAVTLVLGFLVFIHEGGHFLVARLFGVRVTEFMIGLPGPSIGFRRKETRFGITAVPLGGYANVCGMMPKPEHPQFKNVMQYAYEQGVVTCEQVAKAFELSVDESLDILEALVDWGTLEHPRIRYRKRNDLYATPAVGNSPALTSYDVNDADKFYAEEASKQYCFLPFWKRVSILLAGPAMNLLYVLVAFILIYSCIGVDVQNTTTGEVSHMTLNPLQSIQAGCYVISQTFIAIIGLFNPQTAAETVSQSTSIIGIAVLSKDALEAGLVNFLYFSAIISVSLGLMNLLPIPPLDGGRFLIEVIQKISRKTVPMRIQGYLSTAGFILFMIFFLVMVNQDVQRFIFGNWS